MNRWFDAEVVMGTLLVSFPTRILSPCLTFSWRYREPPRLFSSRAMPSWKRWVVPPMIEYGRIKPFGSLRRAKKPGSSSFPLPGLSRIKDVMRLVWAFFSTTLNSCQTSGSFFLPPLVFSSSSALSFAILLLNAVLHSSPNSSILSNLEKCQLKYYFDLRVILSEKKVGTLTSSNFWRSWVFPCKYFCILSIVQSGCFLSTNVTASPISTQPSSRTL